MNLVFSIIKKKPQVCIGEISTLSFDPDKNNQSVSMSLQNHLGLRRGTRCGAVSCISWIQSGASDAWTAAAARKRCLLGVSHAGTNKHNTILFYSLFSLLRLSMLMIFRVPRSVTVQCQCDSAVWRHTSHITHSCVTSYDTLMDLWHWHWCTVMCGRGCSFSRAAAPSIGATWHVTRVLISWSYYTLPATRIYRRN